MKLPTSDQEQGEFVKPKIRKGYYPGKLLGAKVYADKEGNPIETQFKTHQLILEFEVWKGDEQGEPIAPMTYDFGNNKTENVKLGYFTNYEKKGSEKNEEGKDVEVWKTTITPKSSITKVFEALGWAFVKDSELDIDQYIGQFAELNIDTYQPKDKTKEPFSIIKEVGPLNPETTQPVEKAKNEDEMATEEAIEDAVSPEPKYKDEAKAKDLIQRKENMKKMKDDGHLSEDGLKTALESIDAELEALRE